MRYRYKPSVIIGNAKSILCKKDFTNISTLIKLDTSYDSYSAFYKSISKDIYTKIDYEFNCKYCGQYAIRTVTLKHSIPKFCCQKCVRKYYAEQQRTKSLERHKNNVTGLEIKEFYQKYNNLVMYYISQYDKDSWEYLKDWWIDYLIDLTYLTKNVTAIKTYLRKCVYHRFLKYKREQKECFIADLSKKEQIKIYGDVIYDNRG